MPGQPVQCLAVPVRNQRGPRGSRTARCLRARCRGSGPGEPPEPDAGPLSPYPRAAAPLRPLRAAATSRACVQVGGPLGRDRGKGPVVPEISDDVVQRLGALGYVQGLPLSLQTCVEGTGDVDGDIVVDRPQGPDDMRVAGQLEGG